MERRQTHAPRAVVPLTAALEDEDLFVRLAVVYALGQLKDAQALRAVFSALKDEDLYRRAKDILVQVNETYAIEPSIDALRDEDEHVRAWAIRIIARSLRTIRSIRNAFRQKPKNGCFRLGMQTKLETLLWQTWCPLCRRWA